MPTGKSNTIKNELPPISPEALASFQVNKEFLIKKTVQRSLQREHEVAHLGESAQDLLTAGMQFTTQMLEAAMSMGEVALLEDELEWAQDRLPHDGVEMEHVLNRLKILCDVTRETLPPEQANEINEFIKWMIKHGNYLME